MIYNYDSGYLYLLVHEVSLNKDRLRSKYVTVKHKHERFRVIIKCAVVKITLLRQGSKPKAIAMNSNCAHLPNVLKKEHTSIETWRNNATRDRQAAPETHRLKRTQFPSFVFLLSVSHEIKKSPRKRGWAKKRVWCVCVSRCERGSLFH